MEDCRPAQLEDVPRVVELARALRREIDSIRGGPLWARREGRPEPLDDAYAALLGRDDVRMVVGTIEGTVMGFGVGEITRLHDDSALGLLSDLYVEEGARGIGVGEAMADDLVGWLASKGCIGVDAWALPGHRMTKNFFEAHGFVSRGIVVHHPLDPHARDHQRRPDG